MKKIVITTKQLKRINEDVEQLVKAEKPGTAGVVAAATNPETLRQYNQLDGADGGNSKPQMIVQTPSVNGQDSDSKPVVRVDTKGKISNVSAEINNDPDTITAINTGKVNVALTEKRGNIFTKRQIEEARLRKMRDEGVVTTKKGLFEMVSPFTDGDYASTGDPYDLVDNEEDNSLDGGYSFNTIWVDIKGDGTEDPNIKVTSRRYRDSREFNGPEAQKILDAINNDIEECGGLHQSIYKNLYRYVS